MFSPPFSIRVFHLWAWQWLIFLATPRRCAASHWAPYVTAHREGKEKTARLFTGPHRRKHLSFLKQSGAGRRDKGSTTQRLKLKGPGQENQKEWPGKPGTWLPSYFKAKILTEEEDGPYFRQAACSEWDTAHDCSAALGPRVPPRCPCPGAESFLKDWTHPEALPGYPKALAKQKTMGSML